MIDPKKRQVSPENAHRIADWLATRGGLFVWQSADLSNPGASTTTPATTADGQPTGKPGWRFEATPSRHVTSADDVEVVTDVEVKRLRIKVVRRGHKAVLSDASSRRVRAAVAQAGIGAYYVFDGDEAVILKPDKVVPLVAWLADNPPAPATTG